MGYSLPSMTSPAEQVRALMARKDAIEAELDTQASILRANEADMRTPLVDREGFPRADIDIWAVRQARVRIIELRNDLSGLMDEIGEALQSVYDPANVQPSEGSVEKSSEESREALKPFAKVNAVAPGSPAADAGLLRDDLIVEFGHLRHVSFASSSSLQPLSELVTVNENKVIKVVVHRGEQGAVPLSFTPRQGWGGRGMLGCHIVPFTPP
ncbi:hypothetical protein EW146_g1918 [Bondarzewia mesenterica]|uniref:Probable 26S proteasome regulatory subunit p27 n=1 Tax=Bondarzewia mesenterica TaxID=1095465 RepID=A0A4S4M8L5_9AGAM|nr:hypothetical protein EW146_g1918 [Bondarzewia mesenterica]